MEGRRWGKEPLSGGLSSLLRCANNQVVNVSLIFTLAGLNGRQKERGRDRKRGGPVSVHSCVWLRMASRGASGNLWLSQGDNKACVFPHIKKGGDALLKTGLSVFPSGPQGWMEGWRDVWMMDGCYVSLA